MGVRDIILRGLYSFKDTKRAMISGIFAVGANIIFSIALSRVIGVMGISIASSISLTVNFLINSQMLKRHIKNYRFLEHIPVLLKQIPGAIFVVIVVLLMKYLFDSNILIFGLSAVIGIGGYIVILMMMRIEEVEYVKDKVVRRIKG